MNEEKTTLVEKLQEYDRMEKTMLYSARNDRTVFPALPAERTPVRPVKLSSYYPGKVI